MNVHATVRRFAPVLALAISAQAFASLNVSYQFNGRGNWSLDAVGSNNSPVGNVSAFVPSGSLVQKAFLYSSTNFNSAVPTVNFDGTLIGGLTWTPLGVTSGAGLQAFRADVTAIVAAKVAAGGLFNFSVQSENPNGQIDGEALAVVYSNPTEKVRTIAFLDGFSAPAGDTTSINLATPLTNAQLTDPGFEALMSLGIGFGYQPSSQASLVDVNGTRLTSSAGGYDDGAATNGGLITMGGLGDSPTNPANPFQNGNTNTGYDDELYSLNPFLTAGMSSITINTKNPSNDDNIFFAGFNITAAAGVNAPPPAVPEHGSVVSLIGLALAGLATLRRRLRA